MPDLLDRLSPEEQKALIELAKARTEGHITKRDLLKGLGVAGAIGIGGFEATGGASASSGSNYNGSIEANSFKGNSMTVDTANANKLGQDLNGNGHGISGLKSLDTDELFTKARSADAVVYSLSGAWFAAGESLISSGADGATVLNDALTHVKSLSKSGGSVWLTDVLDPNGTTISVPDGVQLEGFGKREDGSATSFGSGLIGSQTTPIVEANRLAELKGLLVVNANGPGVRLLGRAITIDRAEITANTKGVEDNGNDAGDLEIVGGTRISNYTGTSTTAPPGGSVGVDLTGGGNDVVIKDTIVRYFQKEINQTAAGLNMDSVHLFAGGGSGAGVGATAPPKTQMVDCIVDKHGTMVEIPDHRFTATGCEFNLVTGATGLSFTASTINASIAKNNRFYDHDNSSTSKSIDFNGNAISNNNEIYNNTHTQIGNEGDKTKVHGSASFSGDGSTTFFQITTGLGVTPREFTVEPTSAAASGQHHYAKGNGPINITFNSAPPTGSGNITFDWTAKA